MTILYALSEEKEKHTLRTLMLANVSAGQVMIAKVFVSLAVIVIVDVVCFFVIGVDASLLAPYIAIAVFRIPFDRAALACARSRLARYGEFGGVCAADHRARPAAHVQHVRGELRDDRELFALRWHV